MLPVTVKNGEIDFYVQSLKERKRYVVEVNGRQSGNMAKRVLEDGKADFLLYLKENTHGGVEGKTITRPIYTLERFLF